MAMMRDEIKAAILTLRNQVKNPSILDGFLSCLSPQTSIDGRFPFTPTRVITVQDKTMLLHNLVAHAIQEWGWVIRGEKETMDPVPHRTLTEIAKAGFAKYGAYPKERNSVIFVLRTVDEERKLLSDRAAAQERALEMKANQRAGGLDDGEDTKE
jgi:hypothetical protein